MIEVNKEKGKLVYEGSIKMYMEYDEVLSVEFLGSSKLVYKMAYLEEKTLRQNIALIANEFESFLLFEIAQSRVTPKFKIEKRNET